MKKALKQLFVLTVLALVLGAVGAKGGEEGDGGKHRKCIYVGGDGKVYAARELPLSFFITLTPGGDGKIPLDNKAPLLAEGLNLFKRTGKTVFEIYGDGTPPITKAALSHAPSYSNKKNMYHGKGVVLDLTAGDALSGVRETYLSVNGKAFEPLRGTYRDFPADQEVRLRYYSVDNVGNAEEPGDTVFYLDVTPPRTRLEIGGDHEESTLAPGSTISLTSGDALSGVKFIRFKWDQNGEKDYLKKIATGHLSEGPHTLMYFAADFTGNVEAAVTRDFYYDKSPPEVTVSILGHTRELDGVVFVSGDSRVNIEAADNKAGVAALRYRIGPGEEQTYTDPFPLPRRGGIHKIVYTAVDRVNNLSEKQTVRFYHDLTPPETEYEIGGYFDRKQNTVVIRKEARVTLTSADLEAGVKETRYRVNGGESAVYTGPLSFETDGEYTLAYFTVDGVGNRETEKELILKVDNSLEDTGFQTIHGKYPLQWYVDDAGELTGPPGHPFYLVLSNVENPGKDAGVSVLLDLKKLGVDTGAPITFKGGGVNYLQLAVQGPVKPVEPGIFRVRIDAVPPRTLPVFSGAEKYRSRKDLYFGPGLTLSFTGVDNKTGIRSGFRETFVSVDDSAFFTFAAPLTVFSREKRYRCRYYSVDNVGNAEEVREVVFNVDTTPPVTTWDVTGTTEGRVLSSQSVITLSVSDNLSGVRGVYYRFDEEKDKRYRGALAAGVLGRLPDGEHTLFYFAEDNTGNREDPHELSFYLDHRGPVVNLHVSADQYEKGDVLYVSGRSRIGLTAADRGSRVKGIRYQIDGGGMTEYRGPFPVPPSGESGRHTLRFCAVDGVGNVCEQYSRVLFLDTTPPETKLRLTGPVFKNRYRGFACPQTDIELTAADGQSGVRRIYYRIDRSPLKEYTRPFRITAGGPHTIEYHALDRVNNKEPLKKTKLIVDDRPPVLKFAYNVVPKKDPESGVLIFPENLLVSLIASDAHTEVDKIIYRLNDGKGRLYRNPLSDFETGKVYTLKVSAVDRLGNTVEETVTFRIERGTL